jgi:hypothetical protein
MINQIIHRVYKWTETNLKYIDEILTPPATAVVAINDELSTIVLLSLKNYKIDGINKITCLLYKLQDNSNTEFITFLITSSLVRSIFSFNYNDRTYVLLMGDDSFSGIYLWDGKQK